MAALQFLSVHGDGADKTKVPFIQYLNDKEKREYLSLPVLFHPFHLKKEKRSTAGYSPYSTISPLAFFPILPSTLPSQLSKKTKGGKAHSLCKGESI